MRDLVVRITSAHGSWGAGFVVRPGLIATALHVVARRKPDPPVFFERVEVEHARLAEDGRTWTRVKVPAQVVPGAFDRAEDWALLRYDPAALGYEPEPPRLRELGPDEVQDQTLAWRTYGFPEAYPEDGAPATGHVQSVTASQDGLRAIALFSFEAAAGDGMPVRGYSGSPVLVNGEVVGIVRWALTNQELDRTALRRSEGGTMFATPISALSGAAGIELDAGLLPPLRADLGLPAEPFRYLSRYDAADARIFFGRSQSVRSFLATAARSSAQPVMLLYGSAGVGKSSFLRAGILPRREPGSFAVEARDPDGLGATWEKLAAMELPGQGSLRVLDQVEEAWTRGGGREEANALLVAIAKWLEGRPPGLQVVLAFRKGWLPEIEEALSAHGIRWEQTFLQPLDRNGVLDTMHGFGRDEEVQEHYRIRFEDGLPEQIAGHLLGGEEGVVTPVLQVALTRLWERAKARGEESGDPERVLTVEDWAAERRSGVGLRAFVERQISALGSDYRAEVASGMALELLAVHTTAAGTSARLDDAELGARFDRSDRALALARAMQDGWLLIGEGPRARRLAHDTLGPVVREMEAASTRPVQAARRTLALLAPSWTEGDEGTVLTPRQQREVRRASPWMRKLSAAEVRLMDESRRANGLTRRLASRVAQAVLLLPLLALVIALPLLLLDQSDRLHLWYVERELDVAFGDAKREADLPQEVLQGLPGDLTRTWHQAGTTALPDLLRAEWFYQEGRAGADMGEFASAAWPRDLRSVWNLQAWLDGRGPDGIAAIERIPEETFERQPFLGMIWARATEKPVSLRIAQGTLPWTQTLVVPFIAPRTMLSSLAEQEVIQSGGTTPAFARLARHRPMEALEMLQRSPLMISEDVLHLVLERPTDETLAGAQRVAQLARFPMQEGQAGFGRVIDPAPPAPIAGDGEPRPGVRGCVSFAVAAAAGEVERAFEAAGACDQSAIDGDASRRAVRVRARRILEVANRLPSKPRVPQGQRQTLLVWVAHALHGGPEPAPLPSYLLDDALVLAGYFPAFGPLQDDETQNGTAVILRAATRALELGLSASARSLLSEAGDRLCGGESWHVEEIINHMLAVPAPDLARKCLEAATQGAGRRRPYCAAWLGLGEGAKAAACVRDSHGHVGGLRKGLDFALALQRAGHAEEAESIINRSTSRARREELPLAVLWFAGSVDAEVCAEAAAAAVFYARRGDVRQAHLRARACRYEWVRRYAFTEIVASVRGTGLWAPRHLHRWLDIDPEDVAAPYDGYRFRFP